MGVLCDGVHVARCSTTRLFAIREYCQWQRDESGGLLGGALAVGLFDSKLVRLVLGSHVYMYVCFCVCVCVCVCTGGYVHGLEERKRVREPDMT